ncbi:MAG TPA: metallophosphoesterase [Phycisphaerae bacterium]|nr:metallophosphoesterase [Phycisphaerae bacterium]
MLDLPLTPTLLATPHRFLLHTPTNTAILSDLHLGIEHTMRQQGLAFPNINEQKIRESWQHLRTRLEANTGRGGSNNTGHIIIAGDLFDSPSPDPASLALARDLLNDLPPHISVTITPGNHDPDPATLRSLLPRAKISSCETIPDPTQNLLVIHGHNWSDLVAGERHATGSEGHRPAIRRDPLAQGSPATTLIVGHQHPAVTLRSRLQSAKMICYALCNFSIQNSAFRILILPTFSQAPLGTNLINENHWILDCPAPAPADIQIAGIVPGKEGGGVLHFGPLSQLPF